MESESWQPWRDWNRSWDDPVTKSVVEQVESGGAGGRVDLSELMYDHSPLTLGDWLALVGSQMSDLLQGAAESPWSRQSSCTRPG